jgi:hypothetical protein
MTLEDRNKILFVGHRADRTGAPILLLHLLRWLRENTELCFELLLLKGGDLEPEFRKLDSQLSFIGHGAARVDQSDVEDRRRNRLA